MRRTILTGALLALCGTLMAQPHHPGNPLEEMLRPHGHPRPAAANPQRILSVPFDATGLGSPLSLEKGWRVGISGKAAVAAPDFDDSTWALRDAQESFPDVPDEDHTEGAPDWNPHTGPPPQGHQRPFAWFRLHVKLAPNHGPIALLMELPVSYAAQMALGAQAMSVDIFANGKLIQPDGPHGDAPERYQQISRIYDLNLPPNETSLTLVVRTIYVPTGTGAYTSFFGTRTLRLGHPDELNRSLALWSDHNLFERLPRLVNAVLLSVLAVFLLALFFTQRGHVEYLWLALYETIQAPISFVDLAGSSAQLDRLWYAAIVFQLVMVSAYLYFEFLVSFLSLRRRWYILALRYSSPVLLNVAPALLSMGQINHSAVFLILAFFGCLIWTGGWLLFILLTLIRATLRRNFEAGLLLIPLLLSMVGLFEPVLRSGVPDWADGRCARHSPSRPAPSRFTSPRSRTLWGFS